MLFDDPSTQLISPTVEDEIAFGLENFGVPHNEIVDRINRYMELTRLKGYEKRNPHTLSGGEQQACALAAVLAMKTPILVLDEPTSALDPIGTSKVFSIIEELAQQKEYTIVIVSNQIEEVLKIVQRLIVVNKGKIVFEGNPREVLQNVEELLDIGVKPPQVTEFFMRLRKHEKFRQCFNELPITLEEATNLLAKICNDFKLPLKASARAENFLSHQSQGETVIEVKNVFFSYPSGTQALKGINLKINKGEFIGIIGQNGSGKTTLVKHFNGLLKPTEGDVYVNGINTKRVSVSTLARHVGFVFQNPDYQLFSKTVRDELAFGPKNLGVSPGEIERRINDALEALKMDKKILSMKPHELSTAQKQRVAIASTLTMNTDVIVVDEPTTGQDPKMRREIMDLMKRLNDLGKTIIVITHDMNLVAEYIPRTVVMKDGKILIEGPTRQVFQRPEILIQAYLKPPQITELAQKIPGLPRDALTINELCEIFEKSIR
jgi:energy-coupling factor transport system ATP-binding protein